MGEVQFITHYTAHYSYVDSARLALEGGCRWIQLRMKETPVADIEPIAREVQQLCRHYHATFLIDDQVELVRRLQADGVHLGKNDMPVEEARRLLGSQFIIGGTANTFDDVKRLYEAGADYIGCGPFRYTTTKEETSAILGLEAMQHRQADEAAASTCHRSIGGITRTDIPPLMQTGVSGIAVRERTAGRESAEEMRR